MGVGLPVVGAEVGAADEFGFGDAEGGGEGGDVGAAVEAALPAFGHGQEGFG